MMQVMTSQFKCAIVISDFNEEITQPLLASALQRLSSAGVDAQNYEVFHVPGAVEIPYVVQKLAKKRMFDVIVTLGAVVRGETGHYDWVCGQVSDGCMRVMLDEQVPVVFGVLTTDTQEQAQARVDGSKCYKGYEVIDAALHMVRLGRTIDSIGVAESVPV